MSLTRHKEALSSIMMFFILEPLGDPASQSTQIEWKEGMDLLKKVAEATKSPKRKHGPVRSFFQWFLDNNDPSADDIAEVKLTSPWGLFHPRCCNFSMHFPM